MACHRAKHSVVRGSDCLKLVTSHNSGFNVSLWSFLVILFMVKILASSGEKLEGKHFVIVSEEDKLYPYGAQGSRREIS